MEVNQNIRTESPRSEKKRGRRKRKVSGGSPTFFKTVGVLKPVNKRIKGKKMKQMAEKYVSSFIQDSYEQKVLKKEETGCMENIYSIPSVLEQTVDLCESDSVVESANSSIVTVPLDEVEPKNKPLIDLSSDISEPSEVIDLTGPLQPLKVDENLVNHLEPTLIDLSEDESKDQSNFKPENDEILVIGTFSRQSNFKGKCGKSQSPDKWRNFESLVNCSAKIKRKYMKKQCLLDNTNNQNSSQRKSRWCRESDLSKVAKVGENIYVNSPVTLPSSGLRPIIIDGSNVAFVHTHSNFSCKRLEICINYFKEKGHKVTAFVPQFRINSHKSDDPQLLRKLERQGDVVLTPSKRVDGKNIVPYDDRFIVQTAVLKGGIIITRDNYNDLLRENPAWSETIKYRTLAFTWVDDMLMFPKDPLGEFGPSLEEFLRFH